MLNDVGMSEEFMSQVKAQITQGLNFHVVALTQNSWPSFGQCEVKIPNQMMQPLK
jgi:hypothetical protein